jgi:hypothetical protein
MQGFSAPVCSTTAGVALVSLNFFLAEDVDYRISLLLRISGVILVMIGFVLYLYRMFQTNVAARMATEEEMRARRFPTSTGLYNAVSLLSWFYIQVPNSNKLQKMEKTTVGEKPVVT